MVNWGAIRVQIGVQVGRAKGLREGGIDEVSVDALVEALELCKDVAQQAEKEVTELREQLRREEMKSNLFAMYAGAH
ncbi:hypothetical protein [Brevibacillus laterosporus]|uniref:hypothetical protein n=1 Tax=Brevibacillus laterosporus TaxID=1465 RepID=UPI0018CF9D1D|nr:hypothetical protein [Brevibacillus laterosporus]MBG9788743.1 hypothetical protein [Brevibacillus laterosporus]